MAVTGCQITQITANNSTVDNGNSYVYIVVKMKVKDKRPKKYAYVGLE